MARRSGMLYIPLEAPFVIGDKCLWLERAWQQEKCGKRSLLGFRSVLAEVLDMQGGAMSPESVTFCVIVSVSFDQAPQIDGNTIIKRHPRTLFASHPMREEWEDETLRYAVAKSTAAAPCVQEVKP